MIRCQGSVYAESPSRRKTSKTIKTSRPDLGETEGATSVSQPRSLRLCCVSMAFTSVLELVISALAKERSLPTPIPREPEPRHDIRWLAWYWRGIAENARGAWRQGRVRDASHCGSRRVRHSTRA